MANDYIEIRAILRDEVSRALQSMGKSAQQLERELDLKKAANELNAVTRSTELLTRSFTGLRNAFLSAMRTLGVGGLLGGGGLVGSLGFIANSLANYSKQGLNLHYTSQALGVATNELRALTNAGMALGLSQDQAASSIESAFGKLQDLKTRGVASSFYQEMANAAHGSGVVLVTEMQKAIADSGGNLTAGLRVAIKRAQDLIKAGKPEAARFIMDALGLPPNFVDIENVLGRLRDRVNQNIPAMQQYNLAWTNLGVSWDNIKDRIGMAVMPAFERLIGRFDNWLNSKVVQDALKRWTDWIEKDVNWEKVGKNIGAFFTGVNEVIGNFVFIFNQADAVIKAMGLTWPTIFTALIGLGIVKWLVSVAVALGAIGKLRGVLGRLGRGAAPVVIPPGGGKGGPGAPTPGGRLRGLFGGILIGAVIDYLVNSEEAKEEMSKPGGLWGPLKEMDAAIRRLFGDTTVDDDDKEKTPDTLTDKEKDAEDKKDIKVKEEAASVMEEMKTELKAINEILEKLKLGSEGDLHNQPMGGARGESNPILLPPGAAQPGGGASFEARSTSGGFGFGFGGAGLDQQPHLAAMRLPLAEQLQNRQTRQLLFAMTMAEVGSHGRGVQTAFMESLFNRWAARNEGKENPSSLESMLRSPYYDRRSLAKLNRPLSFAAQGEMADVLSDVLGGSNLSNLATGNASETVNRGPNWPLLYAEGDPSKARTERFVAEENTRAWRERQLQIIAPTRKPPTIEPFEGEAPGGAAALPAAGGTASLAGALAAEARGGAAPRGEATIDIEVVEPEKEQSTETLFRPIKMDLLPQMGRTGGNTSTYSPFSDL